MNRNNFKSVYSQAYILYGTSIDTTNFDSYIYTITLVYEDEVDNYTSQFMFMLDNIK